HITSMIIQGTFHDLTIVERAIPVRHLKRL
ncbi:hypothetical protein D043_0492B, partial [Vibrio parahaemolyticus EKP-021]